MAAPSLTLTGEYANDPSTSSPWLIGGAVDLPLDRGGRRSARLRSADLSVLIARYDFAETVWAERMAGRRALIDHFIALQRIETDREMLALRDRQLTVAQRRLNSGAAFKGDMELARLARAAAARDLTQAQAQLTQSNQAIAAILGLSADTLGERQWSWTGFESVPPYGELDQSTRIAAVTGRADVLRTLADYDRADAAYRAEIAKQVPAFTLSPGYTWERGLVKLPLSIGLALPPLDLNRHAIAAAVKAREEAGRQLEAVVAAVSGAIDAALVERIQAAEALGIIRVHDLPVAQAMAKRAEQRLGAGDIDRMEWADMQAALLDARGRETEALARLHAAQADLEDAMRKPLDGPEGQISVSALEASR